MVDEVKFCLRICEDVLCFCFCGVFFMLFCIVVFGEFLEFVLDGWGNVGLYWKCGGGLEGSGVVGGGVVVGESIVEGGVVLGVGGERGWGMLGIMFMFWSVEFYDEIFCFDVFMICNVCGSVFIEKSFDVFVCVGLYS